MIHEYYRSTTLTKVHKRYVRKDIMKPGYVWCEQSAENPAYDVAQGTCDADDLPPDIRSRCDAEHPAGFYTCEWPVEDQPNGQG